MIGRLGDPFLRDKAYKSHERKSQQYEGMGLGLFIAKTLLERTEATLSFSNNVNKNNIDSKDLSRSGAVVRVTWPKNALEATDYDLSRPLAENPKN